MKTRAIVLAVVLPVCGFLSFAALAADDPGRRLDRLPPSVAAPGTAAAGPEQPAAPANELPLAVTPDAGAFAGRIEVFRDPRDLGFEGPALTERLEALTGARRLLLFRAAQFDPLAQGMPDFSEFVPATLEFMVPAAGATTHWIVQFDHAIGAADLAGLRQLGATPLFYVPNDAYLVRAPHDDASLLWTARGVRFVGRYLPGFKVDNALARDLRIVRGAREGALQSSAETADLQLLLSPGADVNAVAARIRTALPGSVVLAAAEGGGIGVVAVRGPADRLPADVAFLANLEDALWVQRRQPARLMNDNAVWIAQTYDTVNKKNYALTLKIHNKGIQGHGQVVGVSDSGVDPDTCWTIDRSLGLPVPQNVPVPGALTVDNNRKKIIAYNVLRDFEGSAVAYEVGSSHGTEVVTCLTGDQGGKAGVTYADPSITNGSHHDAADGMAPGAKVVFLDIGDAGGINSLRTPEIIDDMFIQMYNAGARLSTNSWGTLADGYDLLAFFGDRMVYTHPDFSLFVPAGNNGPTVGSVTSWGNAKNTVVVGGSRQDPASASAWISAGRGPASDGRRKPDVLLTAQGVVSGRSDLTTGTETCATSTNDGTSFSTPLAAGAGTLVRQYFTEGWYPSGAKVAADALSPSAALIKAVLINGARNLTGDGGGNVGPCFIAGGVCFGATNVPCTKNADCDYSKMDDDAPSDYQGFGRVHLDDVLYFAGDARDLRVWDVPRDKGLATGDEWRAQVYVPSTGGGDLELAMTWTDPPSLAPTLSFLVNDLDIVLIAPNGTQYWGNSLATRDRNNATVEYTQANVRLASRIDNVEYVRIPAASTTPGLWTIRVIGASVPGSLWAPEAVRQGFAIALTTDVGDTGGTIELDKSRYDCADTVTVRVRDANAGASVTVKVGTKGGDLETFSIPSISSGVYQGTIGTTFNRPIAPADGVLELVRGEGITATYDDASPVQSATDAAVADCAAFARLGPVAISGGCDGDAFLDAGESVTMTVTLANAGADTLRNVRATLSSTNPDVYVEPVTGSYGDIPAGGSATNATTAFRLSARAGVAPRTAVTLALAVVAAGREGDLQRLDLPLTLEADEAVTNGSYTEAFGSVGLSCSGSTCSENANDGCVQDSDCPASTCTPAQTCSISGRPCTTSAQCTNTCTGTTTIPDGNWYYFDVNGNCESAESTWSMQTCNSSRRPALPNCTGTVTGNGTTAVNHVLVSPIITTGDAGSRTTLQLLTLRETVAATLNPSESTVCDRMQVRVFSNADGVINDTEYLRGQQKTTTLNEVSTTVDFSRSFVWTVPPLPDARLNQLLFWTYIDDPAGGSCTITDTETVRWQVDDVNLTYVNRKLVDDATASCDPGCTAPAAPVGVTVTEVSPGVLAVAWDPAAGADHYDVYRDRGGAGYAFFARVVTPATSLLDAVPDTATYGYRVRAVSANGLCASADSAAASGAGAGPCGLPPGAPTGLTVTRDAIAGCELSLAWGAATSPCGGTVQYRIYRDTRADFAPGPQNLIATTGATALDDTKLESGFNSVGEPVGPEYTYIVRAVDSVSGVEDANLNRVSQRASGPLAPGTWTDDGGDAALPKMTFATLQDYTGAGASWSRTTFTIDHQTNGIWTYVAAKDAFTSTAYADLACIALDTPPIQLASSGTSEFRVFMNYAIEYQWDGLVVELSANGGPFAPITPNGGYPSTFAQTVVGPCQGGSDPPTGYINACNYPPTQGAITGPASGQLSGWIEYVFNLSAYQGQEVRIRLALSTDCGANGAVVVDEMSVTNARLPSACTGSPCLPPPAFDGIASARDLDGAADSGVQLTWGQVDSWGGGGTGTFVLFRNGAEIGTVAPPATSYVDNGAANNNLFSYAVVARGGGSCGLPSPGADITLPAADCTPADPAAVAAATLTVERGSSTVVLRSTTIPNAGAYRFLYSNDPATTATSPTGLDSATPEARHAVLTNGLNYFYLVRDGASPACPAP